MLVTNKIMHVLCEFCAFKKSLSIQHLECNRIEHMLMCYCTYLLLLLLLFEIIGQKGRQSLIKTNL